MASSGTDITSPLLGETETWYLQEGNENKIRIKINMTTWQCNSIFKITLNKYFQCPD